MKPSLPSIQLIHDSKVTISVEDRGVDLGDVFWNFIALRVRVGDFESFHLPSSFFLLLLPFESL